jgi:hypothetical protein
MPVWDKWELIIKVNIRYLNTFPSYQIYISKIVLISSFIIDSYPLGFVLVNNKKWNVFPYNPMGAEISVLPVLERRETIYLKMSDKFL